MSGTDRYDAIQRELEALRKLLEATARPRLSVQLKDAPAVLGIGRTSFEKHVAPYVACWREGSMRVYAIKDLERFLDQHKAKTLEPRRRAA
jgi:hypothetical protein